MCILWRLANFLRLLISVPDDPPSNIRAIGTEPTVIQAYWLPVSNETVNGIALGYTLALFNTAGQNIRNYTLNASVLSLKITGLEIWTNYSIKMAAFTIVGDGPWSDLLLEDTDEESKPQTTHPVKCYTATYACLCYCPTSTFFSTPNSAIHFLSMSVPSVLYM